MENPKVSWDCDAGKLKRLRSEDDVLQKGKFKARKVSALRDFPAAFNPFGRHGEQKSEEGHAYDVVDNYVEPSKPRIGNASDLDDEDVEPVVTFCQESVLKSVFADAEFVKRAEFSDYESADAVYSIGVVNEEEMESMVKDGTYIRLRHMPSAPRTNQINLPKKRKVYAIRDFPDAFLQCDGQNCLQKGRMASADETEDEFGEAEGILVSENDVERLETYFESLRSTAGIEFDHISEFQKFERQDILPVIEEERVIQFAADFSDCVDEAESIAPLAMLEFSNLEEKAESIDALTMLEYDHTEAFGLIDKGNQDSIGQLEVSEELKQDNMLVDVACDELEDKQATLKRCTAMIPKRRKVSAVREFPAAFIKLNATNKGSNNSLFPAGLDSAYILEDDEEPFETYLQSAGYLCHTETDVSFNEDLHMDDALLANHKEESLQLRSYDQATQKEAGFIDQSEMLGHGTIKLIDSSRNAHNAEESGDGANSLLLSIPVSPIMYLPGVQVSGTKSFQGQDLGSEKTEKRIVVQALMAAPVCPWSSRKTSRLLRY